MNTYKRLNRGIGRILPVGLAVVVVVFAALSGFLFYSNTVLQSSLNSSHSSVTSLQTNVNHLNSQITSLNANLTTLQQEKLTLTSQVTSLNANVTSLEQKRTSLEAQLQTAQNNASSLQTKLNQVNSQISSLQTQLNSDISQINSLYSFLYLSNSTTEVAEQQFATGSTGSTQVVSFDVSFAGYVVATDVSASDPNHEGISMVESYSSSIHSSFGLIFIPSLGLFYSFNGTNYEIAIPVSPGIVTLSLETSDTTSQSAMLNVVYYY